jgi:hypothetical protein
MMNFNILLSASIADGPFSRTGFSPFDALDLSISNGGPKGGNQLN